MMASLYPLTVTDIKQYFYCPRVLYFTYCQPVPHKTTYKMEVGQEEHKLNETQEIRRTLKRYGLHTGERAFKVKLMSERLGLSGILDMAIYTPDSVVPVEYKFTSKEPSANHKYQLTAYAIMLEEQQRQIVQRGMIYLIPQEKVCSFQITEEMRDRISEALGAIREMIATERFPAASPSRGRCQDCEYQNYCGDL